MTKFLLRLFVKDTGTPDGRAKAGTLAGAVGIVCNLLLFLGKVITGTLAGSVAIAADGWNNLSDAAASIVTLLGFRFSRKPADLVFWKCRRLPRPPQSRQEDRPRFPCRRGSPGT